MSSIDPTKRSPDGRPVRDTRWRARWRDLDGQHRSKCFDRKIDAQRHLDTVGTDMVRGEYTDPALRRARFDQWAETWWKLNADRFRASTRSTSRRILDAYVIPRFGPRRVGDIDRADVKAWAVEQLEAGAAPRTVRNRIAIVKSILDEAIEGRAIRDNPAQGLRLPRGQVEEPTFLTAAQIEALADAIAPPYGFLVRFTAYTGLRPAEVAGLRLRRLDLLTRRVEVIETLTTVAGKVVPGPTKTFARRTVALPAFLVDDATRYLGALTSRSGSAISPDGYVFRSPTGGPLNTDNWRRRVMIPALGRSSLPLGVRFYDLRHSAAALMIAAGAHPRLVMERLGHADISTTMNVYGHAWPTLHEQVTDRLDELREDALRSPWAPSPATVISHDHRRSA